MFKKLASKFRSSGKTYSALVKHCLPFLADSLPTFSKKEVRHLDQVLNILVAEGKADAPLGPCWEYCIANKLFSRLSEQAEVTELPALAVVLDFFSRVVQSTTNHDLLMQVEFHGALARLLSTVCNLLYSGQAVPVSELSHFVRSVTQLIRTEEAAGDWFEWSTQVHPAAVLLHLFRNDSHFSDPVLWQAQMELSQSRVPGLDSYLVENQLPQLLVSKLSWTYQRLPIARPCESEDLETLVAFLDELYLCSVFPMFKATLLQSFHREFLEMVVAPTLQSEDRAARYSASYYLRVIVSQLSAKKLVLGVVHCLLGRTETGSQHKFSLISPRRSVSRRFVFPEEPFFDISRTWRVMLENLDSQDEDLARVTLQLLHSLFDKGHWEVAQLFVTDCFRGTVEPMHVGAEEFIAMFPASSFVFKHRQNLREYLYDGANRQLELLLNISVTHKKNSDSLQSTSLKGETGGTSEEDTPLFYEGQLIDCLHRKLRSFYSNSVEANVALTGILACLASIPRFTREASTLHSVLLEPCKPWCILKTLKGLASTLDSILKSDPAMPAVLNFMHSALDGSTAVESGSVDTFMNDKALNGQNKRVLQACLILQEFFKELAGVLVYKDLSNDLLKKATQFSDVT